MVRFISLALCRSRGRASRIIVLLLMLTFAHWPLHSLAATSVIFRPAANLHYARSDPTATLLSDGRVLVTGGNAQLPPPELYDPATDTWSDAPPLITPRTGQVAVLLQDGSVLVAGGTGSSGALVSTERYNSTTAIWQATGNLIHTYLAFYALSLLSNGHVLIVGMTNNQYQLAAEVYNPTTEVWGSTGPLVKPDRTFPMSTAQLSDGKVLLFGGQLTNLAQTTSSEMYDPTRNTWLATGDTQSWRPTPAHTIRLPNGDVLAMGDLVSDVQAYHPTTRTWTTRSPLTKADVYWPILLQTGQILLEDAHNGIFRYDPNAETLAQAATLQEDHGTSARPMLLNDGSVLIIGGNTLVTERSNRIVFDTTVPTGSVAINGSAQTTTARQVHLRLNAVDAEAGLGEISFSNDATTWSNWTPYTTTADWLINNGNGVKTVYTRFRDLAGNVSAVVSDTIDLNTTNPNYGMTINAGTLFTNQVTVTLGIGAPAFAEQMQVSNDGGFAGALWEAYDATKTWQITRLGSYVIPRTVYVRYRASDGNNTATYQDDIILDILPPTGSVRVAPRIAVAVVQPTTLQLNASDDVSGVGEMQISDKADFSGATWQRYQATTTWTSAASTIYVRFQDNAGNVSMIYSARTGTQSQVYLPLTIR